jgi:hypothetical protein
MIIARCQALVASIDELAALRQLARRRRELETLRDELATPAGQLARLEQTRQLFLRHHIAVAAPEAEAQAARQHVGQALSLYRQGPERLLERDQFRLREFSVLLRRLADRLETALLLAWQAHCAQVIPAIDEQILGVLSQLPQLRAVVQQIQVFARQLSGLREQLPAVDADVQRLQQLAGQLRQFWEQVGQRLTPTVWDFVDKAAGAGFPLESFDEPLARELGDLGWTPSFVIHTRR